MPAKGTGRNAEVPPCGTALDAILTSVYWLEVMLVIPMLWPDRSALLIFLGLLCTVAAAIRLTRVVLDGLGKPFSRKFLSGPPFHDPLRKPKVARKFCEQGWQLFQHVIVSSWEYALIRNEIWWNNADHCFIPHVSQQIPDENLKLLYLTQLAIWIYTGFSCKYLEDRKKDYYVMMTHHCTTIMLVAGSYNYNYYRIGVLILFVHDVTDIGIDLLKIGNLLKLEGPRAFFLTELSFVGCLLSWFYFRLYIFPVHIIQSTLFGFHRLHADHSPGQFWVNPFPKSMPFYALGNVLLVLLLILHVWWAFLLLRILKGVLTKGAHQAGADEYEGQSSESETEGTKVD